MKKCQLKIPTPVRRQMERLPGNLRQRIQRAVASLQDNPRPAEAVELRTFLGRYRIKLDDHRIVYTIEDDLLIIEVLKVGRKHGPEFYEDID